jgi:hypothetical protein
MPEPQELRTADRFDLAPPLEGLFGNATVTIHNVGVRGVQVEHSDPLRLGLEARLTTSVPEWPEKIDLRGRVVWSRLSKRPDVGGKYLYRSGIRFNEDVYFSPKALGQLARAGVARLDQRSLERKREALLRRDQQRATHSTKAAQRVEISADHLLLVQHARNQLQMNPTEAQKWYQRARFSPAVLDGTQLPYREDVVAVWEYLGRTVDIEIVAAAFEEKKK